MLLRRRKACWPSGAWLLGILSMIILNTSHAAEKYDSSGQADDIASSSTGSNDGVVRFSRVKHYLLRRLQHTTVKTTAHFRRNIPDEEHDNDDDVAADESNKIMLKDDDEDEMEFERSMEVTWYGNSFIPYRYRCGILSSLYCRPGPQSTHHRNLINSLPDLSTPASSVSFPSRIPASMCTLLRWNHELPFTELPNLVFSFLATDMISGHSVPEKTRFLTSLLHTAQNAFLHSNSSSMIFTVPPDVDMTSCKIRRQVEPLVKSLYQMLNYYTSRDQKPLLTLIQATKACLDYVNDPFPLELLPCLDFSFGAEELLNLTRPRSIFGNPELCRQYLRYNITKCLPVRPHFCNEKQLLTLNLFAKRFYLCTGAAQPFGPSRNQTGNDHLTQNQAEWEYEEDFLQTAMPTSGTARIHRQINISTTMTISAFISTLLSTRFMIISKLLFY